MRPDASPLTAMRNLACARDIGLAPCPRRPDARASHGSAPFRSPAGALDIWPAGHPCCETKSTPHQRHPGGVLALGGRLKTSLRWGRGRGAADEPGGGADGAAGEVLAGAGAVGELDALALAHEVDGVLARVVAAAQGLHPDGALGPWRRSRPPARARGARRAPGPRPSATASARKSAVPLGASRLATWWISKISASNSAPSRRLASRVSQPRTFTAREKLGAWTTGILLGQRRDLGPLVLAKPVVPVT